MKYKGENMKIDKMKKEKLQGLKELPGCEIREIMTAAFRGK